MILKVVREPCLLVLLLLMVAAAGPASAEDAPRIDVFAVDGANHPIAGVRVQISIAQIAITPLETDSEGHASFPNLKPGVYEVSAAKEGFQAAHKGNVQVAQAGTASVEFTLASAAPQHDSVDVKAEVAPVDEGASASSSIPSQLARELPGHPATVSDVLPLVPGVMRSPGGGLILSASGEHRSALIVNSADVTDPATGQFGLTVPIDRVETLNVYQTPFRAEFGRFSAGLVSVETRRGGEEWKWELNDPFPDFRIRSYQVRGVRDTTPRLNFEGPLIAGKLYISEGLEYELRKTPVFELPFPRNQKKQEGVNSFSQLDWIASAKQMVTATLHIAPQRLQFVNMNYFNPEQTSPDASTHNYTATVADRLTIWGGLLENTFSVTRFDARIWGQGTQDLTVTPGGNTGNYFSQQDRYATRIGLTPTFSFGALTWGGTHNIKVGSYVAQSSENGQVTEHPINIKDATGLLLERIAFTGGQPFHRSDTESAIFGQDHWIVSPHIAIDVGVRTESQQLSQSFRVAPRAGIAWTVFPELGTVIRAGFGLFYDRVPLNVYSFNQYPNQLVTMYSPAGDISAGPFLYQNGLGTVNVRSPFVFKEEEAGNFSPRSSIGSVYIEQPVSSHVKLRAGYIHNDSSGLVTLNSTAPNPETNTAAYLLSGTGQARYRQFEVTARVRLNEKRQVYFSYVRSLARGDLNDFASFLGSFPTPIIRPNQFGNLSTNIPNRFLAWGALQLPAGFRIAPLFEYRSGFPYAVTDASQNYVGVPYANRFPPFLSFDSRISKDFKVNPKYAVRLSVSGYNLTGHYNPEAFHSNVADPAYGMFFGQRGRRFTADFDVIF